jgi:hypothetical protein
MILAVPYQTIELANIAVQPFYTDRRGKQVAPIYYKKAGLVMQGFTILSPPLTVSSYDCSMNRLQLNITDQRAFANKFIAIQDSLNQTDMDTTLQRLCSQSILTLYLFPSTLVQGSSTIKAIQAIRTISEIQPGETLRLGIRLHHLLRMDGKTPFLRLQHSVPVLYQTNE